MYHVVGTHHIGIHVRGDGFMAKLVRLILTGFNKTHTIENLTSNIG